MINYELWIVIYEWWIMNDEFINNEYLKMNHEW